MRIQNNIPQNYTPNFQAKFFYSDDLKLVAEYAVQHGKFDKLNQARKNIESAHLTKRLLLNIDKTKEGNTVVRFTRFCPRKTVIIPQKFEDYSLKKVKEYICYGKTNPLKFAMRKIIELGNNAPNNNMYKDVVVLK